MTSTLHERLRTETEPDHARIESVLGLPTNVARHVEALKGFYGVLSVWEPAITAATNPWRAELGDRGKLGWLEADLAYLGFSADQIRNLPRIDRPFDDADPHLIFGAMYVLEGSTLGGRMIAKHVERHLGLSAGNGYRFYHGYGDETGLRWRSFIQVLSARVPAGAHDQVVAAARLTFGLMTEWFAKLTAPADGYSPAASSADKSRG